MKAYELSVKTNEEGKLELPEALKEVLPHSQVVRVIVLVNERGQDDEERAWACVTAEQFFSGYSEADAVYDKV